MRAVFVTGEKMHGSGFGQTAKDCGPFTVTTLHIDRKEALFCGTLSVKPGQGKPLSRIADQRLVGVGGMVSLVERSAKALVSCRSALD